MRLNFGLLLMIAAGLFIAIALLMYLLAPSDFVFAEVRGRITYKGEPLPEGSVLFVAQTSGLAAVGGIKPDGSYVLISRSNQDGAAVGRHRVAIMPPYQPLTPNYPLFPKEYMDSDVSGFEVVVEKGKNVFDFNMEERKKGR